MAVGTELSTIFIHVIISLSLLLFASKIFAELFHRIKLPIVLGELLAGIIIGPYALGGLPLFNGEPLVIFDETIKHIGELAAIVILFVAGLEITPREFLKGGLSSFTIGALGVIVPGSSEHHQQNNNLNVIITYSNFIRSSFYGIKKREQI